MAPESLVRHGSELNRWPRLVMGLSILTAGVLLALDKTGRIDASDYLRWWPLAFLLFGAAHILHERYGAALVWAAFGVFWLLPLLGWPRPALWRVLGLWPLLITAAGVTLVLQSLKSTGRGEGFQMLAIMGGNFRTIGWQDLRRGEAVAVMAGCELDLTRAQIAGEAVIDVLAFWGGIEIRVPRGWRIENRVLQILGGFDDKTEPAAENGPRLIIRGSAIMAGVEVKTAA